MIYIQIYIFFCWKPAYLIIFILSLFLRYWNRIFSLFFIILDCILDLAVVVTWILMDKWHAIVLKVTLDAGVNNVLQDILAIHFNLETHVLEVCTMNGMGSQFVYTKLCLFVTGTCDPSGSLSVIPDQSTGQCRCKVRMSFIN